MIFALELKKLRQTGFIPIFLGGGLTAAAVPLINTAVRTETFTGLPEEPFPILMDANWGLMAQLTMLLVVCGCCLIYHTEYADRGALKMDTLPVCQTSLFFGKFSVTLLLTLLALSLQTASLIFSGIHWFPDKSLNLREMIQGMGFEIIMLLPTLTLMLFTASLFQSMWLSLGTGVILTFLGSMIQEDHLILSLIPFAAPYRMLHAVSPADISSCILACIIQTFLFGIMEIIYLHTRRIFT